MTRSAKKAREKKPEMPPSLVSSSILVAETVNTKYSINAFDQALISRCAVQTMNTAIAGNVVACVSQTLRLYRKKGAAGSKLWPGIKVTDRRRIKYLRGHSKVRPCSKSAGFFEESPDLEEVTDHPIINLLRQPDPTMTGTDWWILHFWYKEALGKDFICCDDPEDTSTAPPAALYHLPPQYVRIKASTTRKIDGYWYGRNMAARITIAPEKVMYLTHRPSPIHPLDAESWPQAMALLGDAENAAIQAEIARWNMGGQPGLVISVDENTSEDQVRQIERNVARTIRGVNKTGGVLVLRKSELKQMGVKPNEMHYMEGMKLVEDRIFTAAGWPEAMRKMGSAALASAERADPQYTAYTIHPRLQKSADDLNTFLLPRFGIDGGEYALAFDNPVSEDREALIKEVDTLAKGGLIKFSEGRAMLEIEPDPNIDPETEPYRFNGQDIDAATNRAEPMQTQALQELAMAVRTGDLESEAAKAIAAATMPHIEPEKLDAIFDNIEVKEEQDEAGLGNGQPGGGTEGGGGVGGAGGGADNAPAAAKSGHAPEDKRAGAVDKAKAELPNENRDINKALDRFRQKIEPWYREAWARGVTPLGDVDLASTTPALKSIMDDAIPDIMQSAGSDAAKDIGGDASFSLHADPHAVVWAKNHAADRVTKITETVRERLKARVVDGIQEGKSVDQIRDAVASESADIAQPRAEVIARTETAAAANEGRRRSLKSNGIEKKTFVLGPNPCPICEGIKDSHPDPMDIDEPYSYEGEDFLSPPFHPNCLCSVEPVIDETEDQEGDSNE